MNFEAYIPKAFNCGQILELIVRWMAQFARRFNVHWGKGKVPLDEVVQTEGKGRTYPDFFASKRVSLCTSRKVGNLDTDPSQSEDRSLWAPTYGGRGPAPVKISESLDRKFSGHAWAPANFH